MHFLLAAAQSDWAPVTGPALDPARIILLFMIELLICCAGTGVHIYWLANRTHFNLNTLWLRHRLTTHTWPAQAVGGLLLLLLGGLLITQITGRAILHLITNGTAVVLASLFFHWAGLTYIVLYMGRNRLSWNSVFGMSLNRIDRRIVRGLRYYLAIMPPVVIGALLANLLLSKLGIKPSMQDVCGIILNEPSIWMKGYLLFLAVILAPLFEELLFRGILFPLLAGRLNVPLGMTITSLIFAVTHFHTPSLFPLFLFSMGLCFAYWRTGSLWTSIFMHLFFNTINIGLLLFAAA